MPAVPDQSQSASDVVTVAEMEAEAANPVVIDGYLVDGETGEVLGIVTPKAEFTVQTAEDADWVLAKILQAEAALASIDSRPEIACARAILANAERLKKDESRRLDWLHRRFDAELGDFARRQLDGKKTKTFKTLFGAISLRTKKGGLRVANEESALTMARKLFPHAVRKTEKFMISSLTATDREQITQLLKRNDEMLPGHGSLEVSYAAESFRLEPDAEVVDVKTGIATENVSLKEPE